MKLQFPFIQLPLMFDARALAAELEANVAESDWRPHPQGFPGNSALPLIALGGDADDDGFVGPMRPTLYLARLPYLRQVLASFGAVLGRTRLMRLAGQAEVTPHVDQTYYWAERMRVHVPIVTQPGVRFHCGDEEIHMAAGECWIFDTWRKHRVMNHGDEMRIHLVADTVGGDGFWEHMSRARPHHVAAQGWALREVALQPGAEPDLHFETVNSPVVMSPWELRSHFSFLFGNARPQQPALTEVQAISARFMRQWQALWSRFGDDPAGRGEFRRLLNGYSAQMQRFRDRIVLVNGVDFQRTLTMMVLGSALQDEFSPKVFGKPSIALGQDDDLFERPVFIISPPRSGSTLLFETLAKAPGLHTIGGESHNLLEGTAGLSPAGSGWDSNRLQATDASGDTIPVIRACFRSQLRDRDGVPPSPGQRLRMLEKTPKNALRVPFLKAVFPQARFICLQRDPRQTLASMFEGWQSGRFRTYPQLPGWQGLPWSFLLVPGWRELSGRPLEEVVVEQWRRTVGIIDADFAALPADDQTTVDYDGFLRDPQGEAKRLCEWAGVAWDQTLQGDLPLSRYTVTPPQAGKWRRHESWILPALEKLGVRTGQEAA